MERKIPQLQMRRKNLENLPDVIMPEEYSMRTFKDGDESAWCEIINKTVSVEGTWDLEKFNTTFRQSPVFDPERIFFAIFEDKSIGTAMAWVKEPEEKITGMVHYVGVLPEHRGKNLGYLITLKVLHYMKKNGFKDVFLDTDDYRLSAIKTYLELGFEPEIIADNQSERWAEVFRNLRIEWKTDKSPR